MKPVMLRECREITAVPDAALLDLGDGIACLEFRSRGNSITPGIKDFTLAILDQWLHDFDGLIIGNQSKNFSVGANLNVMKQNLDRKDYMAFYRNVCSMQAVTKALKYYPKPVVAAPYRRTLGGGLEIVLHCHKRVAHSECLMGLVELGVGLVPAGGGTKECALRIGRAEPDQQQEVIRTVFETLLLRKVSDSARNAREMLFLSHGDPVTENREALIAEAKEECRRMVGKILPVREASVVLPGRSAYEWMTEYANQLLEEGRITPYDAVAGTYLAAILAGSANGEPARYTEDQLLNLEREAFMALVQEQGTYDRIAYFTEHNALLRN